MTCLICRYYQPIEPPEHRKQREAGRCQSFCGDDWNTHTAISYVREHGRLDGWCRLHPEAKRFPSGHVCGDISVYEYFFKGWGVERFDSGGDGLFEWASNALQTVLHGNPQRQRERQLSTENTELKRQLKRAREVSASRLKRLQKVENKPAPAPAPKPAPAPAPIVPEHFPRLVAEKDTAA
jgi:hypothetical protein